MLFLQRGMHLVMSVIMPGNHIRLLLYLFLWFNINKFIKLYSACVEAALQMQEKLAEICGRIMK